MENNFSITDILFAYFSTLPELERDNFSINGRSDPKSLANGWGEALTADTTEGIIESFRYYKVLRTVSTKEEFRLSYNDTGAGIYPFVVRSIFNLFPSKTKDILISKAACGTVDDFVDAMRRFKELRNSFRLTFLENINGPILSFLYSMVYLMGFSSGGESSFLTRVFPLVKKWEGHILDAGGGSGFAGLMVSTRGTTTYIDFSPFRAKRAEAAAKMAVEEDRFFENMLDLIDLESDTFGLALNRSLIPKMTSSITENLHHKSGDLSRLPEGFGPFDGAIITDVLEHTTDPENALSNVANSLRPNAPLVLTVPTELNGTGQCKMEEENGLTFPFLLHIRFFSDEAIEKTAGAAGLELVELKHFHLKDAPSSNQIPMEVMAILRKK